MQQLRLFFAMALLYMFRVTIPPIIRSTMLYMAFQVGRYLPERPYTALYSWWWVELSPKTCRVKPLRRINAIVASCWNYFTIKHDAWNHKYYVWTYLHVTENIQHAFIWNFLCEDSVRHVKTCRCLSFFIYLYWILNMVLLHLVLHGTDAFKCYSMTLSIHKIITASVREKWAPL